MKNTNTNDIITAAAMLRTMQPVFDAMPISALVKMHDDLPVADDIGDALANRINEIIERRRMRIEHQWAWPPITL